MAVTVRPPSGAFPLLYATPVRLPLDVPPDDRLVRADGARVVAPRPHRPVPARKGPPLMVPLARHGRAHAPGLPTTSLAAAPGRNPEADARVVGAGAPPPPSRRRPSGRSASRASRRPPLRSRRTAPSRDASASAPRGTRNAGSCAMGYPSRGSRPSRTAQPPLRAPVAGWKPPSRKDDRGGTTAGTTGIASGFLTRIKHDPQACNFDNFRQQTPARARAHQSRLFGLSRKSNSPIVRMPSSSM